VTSDEQRSKVRARGYRDLLVWQEGMVLAKAVYQLTGNFPKEEKFGLVSQMHREAISIPSNIAEGQARKSTAEFVQFVSTAEGSLAELDTQLQLTLDLGFCLPPQAVQISALLSELKRMLNGLRRTLLKE
jgi:four helix bundle protein